MSLTLNISEEERACILAGFSDPAVRANSKLSGQSHRSDKDDEAPATLPARVLGRARLSDVVRSAFDPGERSDDEDYQRPLPKHAESIQNLANALAEVMVPDISAEVPFVHNPHRTPKETSRGDAFNSIRQLDAKNLAMRLMKEPSAHNWMRYITFTPGGCEFTASDLPTIDELVDTATKFKYWANSRIRLLKEKESLKALLDDLIDALWNNRSIEDHSSIVLYMFWAATDLWMSVDKIDFDSRERAGKLLRNYVATRLLVESTR